MLRHYTMVVAIFFSLIPINQRFRAFGLMVSGPQFGAWGRDFDPGVSDSCFRICLLVVCRLKKGSVAPYRL